MPVIGTITQQPSDREDYDIDFSDWFPSGDPVITADVTHSPISPSSDLYVTYAISTPLVKVWVSGGVSGVTYKVTVSAQTATRSKEVELKVKIKDD